MGGQVCKLCSGISPRGWGKVNHQLVLLEGGREAWWGCGGGGGEWEKRGGGGREEGGRGGVGMITKLKK